MGLKGCVVNVSKQIRHEYAIKRIGHKGILYYYYFIISNILVISLISVF